MKNHEQQTQRSPETEKQDIKKQKPQRKNDFSLQFLDEWEIKNSDILSRDEKIRELVKHYAMCLFGIATDLAEQEEKYNTIIDNALLVREDMRQTILKLRGKISSQKKYIEKLKSIIAEQQGL